MYKELYPHDELENLTEELVYEAIHNLIEGDTVEVPQTAVSIQDIAAISLNNLKPLYICSFFDKKNPRESLKHQIIEIKKEVETVVLQAVDIVNKNPHD